MWVTILRYAAALACFVAGAAIIAGRWGAFWSLWTAAGAFGEAAALVAGVGTLSACVGWLARQRTGVLVGLSAVITSLVVWLPYHWRLEPVFFGRLRATMLDDVLMWIAAALAYVGAFLFMGRKRP
jgi:hypothetical protein